MERSGRWYKGQRDGGRMVEFNHLCAISGKQHRENRRIAILVVVVKKEAVVRW